MADLNLVNSTYQTGTIDTASTLTDNVDTVQAQHQNGPNSAIIGIETILGDGPTLKGTKADLATRLAVAHNTDGTIKAATTGAFTGIITVPTGGTGVATLTAGAIPAGNGTGAIVDSGAGIVGQVLLSGGSGAPTWGTGLLFHGPVSVGSGSTRSHEGTVTISANQNLSGVHFYTNFTLNSGITITVPTGKRRLIILATGTITISGTINAKGAGGSGGTAAPSAADPGTDQPGGVGSSSNNAGPIQIHGSQLVAGGSGQLTGSDVPLLTDFFGAMGGSGGSSGYDGFSAYTTGGEGGGSIVLVAPTVILSATAVLNTSGNDGSGGSGSGGGGGSGNVYVRAHTYTDQGATFTMNGGAAGGGGASAGANGIKQINIY